MNAFFKISHGLYMLSAQDETGDNGCIINTAVWVANNPERVSISVIQKNKTHDMIKKTGRFCLSTITTEADFELFKHFGMRSGKDFNKFAGYTGAVRSEEGLYRLSKATNMYMVCQVEQSVDLGSHTLFVAHVIEQDVFDDIPTCTYDYYNEHIKAKPTTAQADSWVCTVCGYVYKGNELPEDYLCPLCKHGKEFFKKNK